MGRNGIALLALAVPALLLAAACGGGSDDSKSDKAADTAATSAPAKSQANSDAPTFSGGKAKAEVNIGGKTFSYDGGSCQTDPDDKWLAVNIGTPTGDDYFGISLGAYLGEEAAKPAKGGGVFTSDDTLVIAMNSGGTGYLINKSSATIASDLKSGQFEGTDFESGGPVTGSFTCD